MNKVLEPLTDEVGDRRFSARRVHALLPLLLAPSIMVHAQLGTWAHCTDLMPWASGAVVQSSTTDAAGNTYLTGRFQEPITFSGLSPLTSAGSTDVFVVKIDGTGTPIWAVRAGGTSSDEGRAIATDSAGNVYVGGVLYSSSSDFSGTTITALSVDGFVAKYDGAGQLLWVERLGGSSLGLDVLNGLTADESGNCFIGGACQDDLLVGIDPALSDCGEFSTYLMKLDTQGDPVWSERLNCQTDDDLGPIPSWLRLDASGGLYVGGQFQSENTMYVSDTLFNPNGSSPDLFVARHDTTGAFHWARSFGGNGNDEMTAMAVDDSGGCYLAAYRAGTYVLPEFTIDFAGSIDIYHIALIKALPSGVFSWGDRIGNDTLHRVNSMAVDSAFNLYLSGYFKDRCEFDNIVFEDDPSHTAWFVAQYDTSGAAQDVLAWRSQEGVGSFATTVGVDATQHVSVTGYLYGTMQLGSLPPLSSGPSGNWFYASTGDLGTGSDPLMEMNCHLRPNPSDGHVSLMHEEAFDEIIVWDALGRISFSQSFAPITRVELSLHERGILMCAVLRNGHIIARHRMVIE